MDSIDSPAPHDPVNVVAKSWGREVWFANNSLYCGKILEIDPGHKSSMHYHGKKDETLYVLSGTLQFTWINKSDGTTHTRQIDEGKCVRVFPGQPHRLEAIDQNVVICEVSTHHDDADSFRIPQPEYGKCL